MIFALIIIIALIVIFTAMSVKIVRQSEVYIIERLGKFHKVADARSYNNYSFCRSC